MTGGPLDTELSLEGRAESRNRLGDRLGASSRERSTEEHRVHIHARCLEPASTRDKNPVVNGSVEDVLFNLFAGLARRKTGVLLPIDSNPMLCFVSSWSD